MIQNGSECSRMLQNGPYRPLHFLKLFINVLVKMVFFYGGRQKYTIAFIKRALKREITIKHVVGTGGFNKTYFAHKKSVLMKLSRS